MKLPELFIFDMDGLIFDTERVFMHFITEVMAEHGYTLTEEQYIRTLGRSRADCIAIMKGMFGEDFPSWELSGIARDRLDAYAREHAMPEKPGIRELLRTIQARGIHCCIASSSPRQTVEIYLKTAGLSSFFDFIMSGEELTHSKPDPEVFVKCIEHYGIDPEKAVVLEDSEPGIEASVRAGIPVICIPDMKEPSDSHRHSCLTVARDGDDVREFFFGREQDPKLPRKLALRYSVVLGSYWGIFCSFYSYSTVYLLSKGFDSSAVGVIIAVGNILGLLLQPVFASMADRGNRLDLHQLTVLLSAVMLGFSLFLFAVPVPAMAAAGVYLLMDALMWILMPLTNALSMYYVNRRIPVDFGIPRGMGSIVYAIISAILGGVVASRGASMCMLFTAGLLLALMLGVLSLPRLSSAVSDAGEEKSVDAGLLSFFRRYPRFMMMLLGFTIIFIYHNISNNFMIYHVQALGGDEGNLGTILSISAIVELPAMFGIRRLLSRFREITLMRTASVFFVIKALAYVLAFNIPTLYSTQIFQGAAYAVFIPTSVYFVNSIMSGADKVKGQAFMTMTNTLGGVIGSLLGGVLIRTAGVPAMLYTDLGLAVVGAALALFFMDSSRR